MTRGQAADLMLEICVRRGVPPQNVEYMEGILQLVDNALCEWRDEDEEPTLPLEEIARAFEPALSEIMFEEWNYYCETYDFSTGRPLP